MTRWKKVHVYTKTMIFTSRTALNATGLSNPKNLITLKYPRPPYVLMAEEQISVTFILPPKFIFQEWHVDNISNRFAEYNFISLFPGEVLTGQSL